MISYLNGTIRTLKQNPTPHVVLVVADVGYEVSLPVFVYQGILSTNTQEGSQLELEIYYHQTEKQPKPLMVGFRVSEEKEFFEKLISVTGIGPTKAAQALTIHPQAVAEAIENGDESTLSRLPGIGERASKKIIATLKGKLDIQLGSSDTAQSPNNYGVFNEAVAALVSLQYRPTEAQKAVEAVIKNNPKVKDDLTEILKEVFKIQKSVAN